jgi:hypothetical protein
MDLPRSQTMTSAYAAVYEADKRTPQQIQASENEYDAYEAETGGDISMDEWKKSKLKKKTKSESYDTSSYLEGFKPMDLNKMQDKAAMKPDTAKGEKQARKIDKIRAVGKHAAPEQEEGAKLQAKLNKVNPLKRAFKKPSFDKTKNKAYGLEQKRRSDLDNRYGPKKEEVAEYLFDNGYALSEESAETMSLHLSFAFLESISEEILDK